MNQSQVRFVRREIHQRLFKKILKTIQWKHSSENSKLFYQVITNSSEIHFIIQFDNSLSKNYRRLKYLSATWRTEFEEIISNILSFHYPSVLITKIGRGINSTGEGLYTFIFTQLIPFTSFPSSFRKFSPVILIVDSSRTFHRDNFAES